MGFIKKAIKGLIKSFIKLSRPIFTFENNELKFKIDLETFYTYPIENYETKTRHDSYVLDAYTLKNDDIYLEYIRVDNDVEWNGAADGFFIYLFKEQLKIKTMEVLEKKEFGNYEFITYKIDGHFILNFIYIYEVSKDIFILDIKSELYENLIKNFDSNYIYSFDKNEESGLNIDVSLVKNNAFNNYFSLSSSN